MRVITPFVKHTFETYFDIRYSGKERLEELRGQKILPISKHQSWVDFYIMANLLYTSLDTYGYYMKKESLPDIISIFWTYDVMRKQEYNELREKIGKDESRVAFRSSIKRANDITRYLLSIGEIPVIYVEGTRNMQESTKLSRSRVQHLIDLQKDSDPITFVPVCIEYDGDIHPRWGVIATPRMHIKVGVGEPIQVPDDGVEELIAHLAKEVELFEA